MSTFKFKFDRDTELVTLNWIRNNYKGKVHYLIALKYLTATYIQVLFEQWKASSDSNCIVSKDICSRTLNIVRYRGLVPKLPIGSIVHGSMGISTRIIAHHMWRFTIHEISKQMSIGFDTICGIPAYRLLMYSNDQCDPCKSMAYEEIHNTKIKFNIAHVDNKEGIYIKLRGTAIKIMVNLLPGKDPKVIRGTIDHGVYKLAVRLFDHGDCIQRNWQHSYEYVPYEDDICIVCGYLINADWFYCANCSHQLY